MGKVVRLEGGQRRAWGKGWQDESSDSMEAESLKKSMLWYKEFRLGKQARLKPRLPASKS